MKDIDFDELDRAVSSLMKTVPQRRDADLDDDTKVVTITSQTPAAGSVQVTSEDDFAGSNATSAAKVTPLYEEEPAVVVQEKVTPPSPAMRRGRFMDMVRPSDQAARRPLSTSTTSRHGTTLQPASTPPFSSSPVPDVTEEPDAFVAEKEQVVTAENYDRSVIDELGIFPESTTDESASFEEEIMTNDQSRNADMTPLNSPFLPDAKVEKRPLGRSIEVNPSTGSEPEMTASTDDMALYASSSLENLVSVHDKDAQLPEQPLPAELGSELLSIETGTATASSEEPAARPESDRPSFGFKPSTSVTSSARTMAATSIQQQYKVQPSQKDTVPTGAIYDTQPLAHPAKKHPGWLWVVAIIVICLLGAGSGAAIYYLGIL